MIAEKFSSGASVSGRFLYAAQKPGARVLVSTFDGYRVGPFAEPVHPQEAAMAIAEETGHLRQLNNFRVEMPSFHFSLALAPGERLSERQWAYVSQRYMEEMGYGSTPYVAVLHSDRDHEHVHLVGVRIDRTQGRSVDDWQDYDRSAKVVQRIEKEFGLTAAALTPSEARQQQERTAVAGTEWQASEHRGERPRKDVGRVVLKAAIRHSANWDEFEGGLNDKGYRVLPRLRGEKVVGWSLEFPDGVAMKSSEFGKAYRWAELEKAGVTEGAEQHLSRWAREQTLGVSVADHLRRQVQTVLRDDEPVSFEQLQAALQRRGVAVAGEETKHASIRDHQYIDQESGVAVPAGVLGRAYRVPGLRQLGVSYEREDASFLAKPGRARASLHGAILRPEPPAGVATNRDGAAVGRPDGDPGRSRGSQASAEQHATASRAGNEGNRGADLRADVGGHGAGSQGPRGTGARRDAPEDAAAARGGHHSERAANASAGADADPGAATPSSDRDAGKRGGLDARAAAAQGGDRRVGRNEAPVARGGGVGGREDGSARAEASVGSDRVEARLGHRGRSGTDDYRGLGDEAGGHRPAREADAGPAGADAGQTGPAAPASGRSRAPVEPGADRSRGGPGRIIHAAAGGPVSPYGFRQTLEAQIEALGASGYRVDFYGESLTDTASLLNRQGKAVLTADELRQQVGRLWYYQQRGMEARITPVTRGEEHVVISGLDEAGARELHEAHSDRIRLVQRVGDKHQVVLGHRVEEMTMDESREWAAQVARQHGGYHDRIGLSVASGDRLVEDVRGNASTREASKPDHARDDGMER